MKSEAFIRSDDYKVMGFEPITSVHVRLETILCYDYSFYAVLF